MVTAVSRVSIEPCISERATTPERPWWEVAVLPWDVTASFRTGVGREPLGPVARKWLRDAVPFVWYVVRPYGFHFWEVYAPEGGIWLTDGEERRRRRFRNRERAMQAVDEEVRKRESER